MKVVLMSECERTEKLNSKIIIVKEIYEREWENECQLKSITCKLKSITRNNGPLTIITSCFYDLPPSSTITNSHSLTDPCHHNLPKLATTHHHHTPSLTSCYRQEPS